MTLVPVLPCDREAAASVATMGALTKKQIRDGQYDDLPIVQAFARHRLAALEAAVKVAKAAVRVRQSYAYGREVLNPEVEEIATAIRALSSSGVILTASRQT